MPMPLPPGKRLAIPPMRPDISPAVRAKVLDYIERRMFVEAVSLVVDDEYERRIPPEWSMSADETRDHYIGKELMDRARSHIPTADLRGNVGRGRRQLAKEPVPCAVPECSHASSRRGMCDTDYRRWLRSGQHPLLGTPAAAAPFAPLNEDSRRKTA